MHIHCISHNNAWIVCVFVWYLWHHNDECIFCREKKNTCLDLTWCVANFSKSVWYFYHHLKLSGLNLIITVHLCYWRCNNTHLQECIIWLDHKIIVWYYIFEHVNKWKNMLTTLLESKTSNNRTLSLGFT